MKLIKCQAVMTDLTGLHCRYVHAYSQISRSLALAALKDRNQAIRDRLRLRQEHAEIPLILWKGNKSLT